MKIYGHRGAAGHCKENTLPSLRAALELGVDGIEFDVRLTRDGIPVVIHDETIDRTTGQTGEVRSYSRDELSQLLDGDEGFVPTLEEAIIEIGDRTMINVEIKEHEAAVATYRTLCGMADREVIRDDQVLITSFVHHTVRHIRELGGRFSVGLLTKGLPEADYWTLARTLHASSANIDVDSVESNFVQTAKANDLQVMVYTVNTLPEANRMRDLGIDAIFRTIQIV